MAHDRRNPINRRFIVNPHLSCISIGAERRYISRPAPSNLFRKLLIGSESEENGLLHGSGVLGGEGGAGSTLEDTGGGEGRQGVRRPAGDLSGIGEAFQAASVCEHAPAGLVLQVLNRPMQHDGQLLAVDVAVGTEAAVVQAVDQPQRGGLAHP